MNIKLTRPITIKIFHNRDGMTVSGSYVAPEVKKLSSIGEYGNDSAAVYKRDDGKVVIVPTGIGVEWREGGAAWVAQLRFLEDRVELVKWDPRPDSDGRVIWTGEWVEANLS